MQSILEKLFVYRDELAKVGADATAKMVNDIAVGMSRAMINGIEFSEEMLNTLGKFIDEENIACLNSVNQIIGYLTDLKISGSNEFDQLWQEFRAAMIQMDKDSFEVLQGVLNNINTVTQAAYDMQKVVKIASETKYGQTVTTYRGGIATGSISEYDEGGVVDYTGPAAVHGSKSHPEVVFNAEAAAKLYNYVVNTPDLLKSAFANITADSSMLKGASQINNSPSIGDININITGNADADTVLKFKQLAANLRDEVVKSLNDSMNRRGIMRSPRTI